MSETIFLTKSQLSNYSIKVVPGKTYKFKITSAQEVMFIEVPDILFNLDSAIPLLDKDRFLVRALFTAQIYSADNIKKELVIFGHADTSGQIEYNYTISEFRAIAIKAILQNDQETWRSIAQSHASTKDYQVILNTLDTCYQWGCGCGDEDNVDGPKTKTALKIFQQKANEKYSCNLVVDGEIGPETWGAILTTYYEIIKAQHNNTNDIKPVTMGYTIGNGIYGCGESFPIDQREKDNYRSELNRRVELLFFNKGSSDILKPPPNKQVTLKPEECFPYDEKLCRRIPVPLSLCGGDPNADMRIFDSCYEQHLAWTWTQLDENDDLKTSLANCDLRMAFEGEIEPKDSNNKQLVTITKLAVYIRDSFDYVGDQTLGDWRANPPDLQSWDWGNGYADVDNATYRNWRAANGIGHDFLVYTNVEFLTPSPNAQFRILEKASWGGYGSRIEEV